MPAGEGVVQHACVHAAGLHQRVLNGGGVPYGPSDESATVRSAISGSKGAVEDAIVDGDSVARSAQRTDQSAVGAVAADATRNSDGTATAREGQRSVRLSHDAAGKLCAGGDGAGDMQVFNHGVLDVAEWSRPCLRCVIADGERLAVAVKRALERVGIADAHHHVDADVVRQFYELAAEVSTIVDVVSERVPFVCIADDIRIHLRA